MYYFKVHIVLLLYGFSHGHGFFHFRNDENFQFLQTTSFEDSSLQDYSFLFEQPVDHFNQSDQRTWKQKYLKIMDLWKPGGPILLHIYGESSLPCISGRRMRKTLRRIGNNKSLIDQILDETGAAYFVLEHRYYGDTKPFDDQNTENLAFLSSRQALADTALFVQTLKNSTDFINSKVIFVGCSYAGNLAAWMEVMYPSLVDAVISGNAPVLAKKDYYEYLETVTDTFRSYGSQECVNRISDKFNNFRKLLKSPKGIEQLKLEQNICKHVDMTVPENQQLFFDEVIEEYSIKAQYGTPNVIAEFCNNLNSSTSQHKYRFSVFWNDDESCLNFNYDEVVKTMLSDELWYWFYQTCTEFGYYQSTTSSKQMFGPVLPVDFFYKTCSVLFGEEFNEQRVDQGVTNVNKMYGGLSPNVSNVVFVNADMDPWHRLGILEDLSADVPAIYIKGSSHCRILNRPSEDDSDSLKEARIKIKKLIKKWIGAQ